MAVPNTFATKTGTILLSELDTNFSTPITIGSTPIALGDTETIIAGITLVTPALGTPSTGNLANCSFPTLNQDTTGTASNVTGLVLVGNGGTGVTTSTGTGNTVLSASPTFTGTLNSANLAYTGTLTGGTGVIAIGTDQIYKDASGNVGIGTSSPATWGKFAVVGASSGGQVVASIANTSGTANTQAVLSFDTTNNGFNVRDSQIRATNSGGNATTLEFYTANAATPAERMRIDSAGNVTLQENISVGGAAPTTSGAGITFPATQSASSNANTLDDYEEGTYTPVLTFTTTGTMTYTASSANGVYTKIGNVVTCRVALVLSAFTAGTASGQARISLPFTSAQNYFSASTYATNFTTTYPTLLLSSGAVSYVNVYGNAAINATPVGIVPANFQATSQVLFSITYTV